MRENGAALFPVLSAHWSNGPGAKSSPHIRPSQLLLHVVLVWPAWDVAVVIRAWAPSVTSKSGRLAATLGFLRACICRVVKSWCSAGVQSGKPVSPGPRLFCPVFMIQAALSGQVLLAMLVVVGVSEIISRLMVCHLVRVKVLDNSRHKQVKCIITISGGSF